MNLDSYNSVAVLSFPEDEVYPRLTASVREQLAEALTRIWDARLFRGVIIAANSKSFATGADVSEISDLDGVNAREFALAGQSLMREIRNFSLPVVAAVRGYCLGGGLDLALACHARVATFDSSFGHPGGSLGLLSGWGGTQRLARLVGKGQALQLPLTGERIPATQAATLGLVDELATSQDLIGVAARRVGLLASVMAFDARQHRSPGSAMLPQ